MSCMLLQHIRCVQQVHCLATAVTKYKPDLMTTFDMFALSAQLTPGQVSTLTQSAAQVTKLVLQHCDSSPWQMVSRQDQDCTLTWVQRHVYGAHSASMSLMEQVYSTSVEQAVMVREALVYILQHHLLAISNCCSMLETARQASIASLADRALGLLCGNYMHMLQCHGSTLGELSQETLMLVLCHDNLQVECEEDVCNALQHWVLADPLERKALFGDLFVQAVRLRQMTYNQVRQIDDHTLVAQDRKACMAVARALLEMMIGAPTRQQPRQVPAEPKAAEQQFLACPSHSQWTLPGSSLNSHSCSHGQPAVQPQHASSHNLTQLSFAMHQGSKPVQHQQATGPAQHCQLSPLQWRYDQNYSSRVNRQQRQPQDDQESSSSEGVQLSCSEEFDVDEHDMQSCGVSKLRLGTSQSEEDLHAESASICNLRSEAELHQSIPEAYVHSSSSSTQAASPSNVGCSSCALQQESNCAAIACTASQRKDDERWDCERCAGVDTSHEQACASASAPQLAPIRRKSSSGKRLPQSWQTLADEMAVSPSHQAPQKRAKPDQVRKLKF